ncbi:MAG: ATP synthase F1 subunit delta [Bacteroidetes bacterium]|nr:MAG: ATP synthase F1 subunit delta [Bacteroidota bacterium]
MRETRVASRYAKSFIGLCIESGKLEEAYKDMSLIVDTCTESKDLMLLLKSPIVKPDKKVKVLQEIFSKHINSLSNTFISIITKHGRENYLAEIAIQFQKQYKEHKKIVTAIVSSADGLDESIRSVVLKTIEDSVKSEVELIEKKNEDLIGGLVIRIGDKQYDASIQRSINDLKKTFKQKHFTNN